MTLEIDLAGRRVAITGAGQGIGRGLALAFAMAGAEVLVNDLRMERADDVVEEACAAGGLARAFVFDVTDYGAVTDAFVAAGAVDVLINNAGNAGADGFRTGQSFAVTEPVDWEPFLRVNLYGVLHCTRAVLPAMVERNWGRIITIVSDAGRTGDPNSAAYATAKAGAAGFTRSIAVEMGRFGITANNIALGTMRTPLTEPLWSQPDAVQTKAILRNYAIRRPGTSEDVTHLAALLASEHGSWITGQTLPVNGGFSFAL